MTTLFLEEGPIFAAHLQKIERRLRQQRRTVGTERNFMFQRRPLSLEISTDFGAFLFLFF